MLWHIELKFCICLCFTVLQIKFECRQFASIFVGVMPLLELRILEIHTFLLHPLTYWAESLHIILFFCTTDRVWVSSLCVYFGVMPLFELRILQIQFSALFSFTHALTYWAEILHMTLLYCTTGQLQDVSSMGINFCRNNVPFGT